MKAVAGGMKWTIITIIVGIIAIALLIIFMTSAGKSITGMLGDLIDSFGNVMCSVIGRMPLVGVFMGCS
jgi:hypothetical protein